MFADSEPVPVSDGVTHQLLQRIGLGDLPLVNLLVPATADTVVPVEATLTSRPNVVLQTRDGQGPGAVTRPVPHEELPQHAAAGLAMVGGLWTAMDEAPFDRSGIWPGQQVVVARAHARLLDSRAVLAGLSDAVHRDEGPLPRPRSSSGERLTEVTETQALPTAESAAVGVVDAHAGITRFRPPAAFQAARPKPVGLFSAVWMFLTYLWAAVRNAPRSWVDAVVRRTARGLSAAVTSALFGSDSAYEVVVLGVRPDGSPAAAHHEDDVSALVECAQQMAHVASPGTEFAVVDTSVFWSEMTGVGVSLADGSDTPSAVHMPMLGPDRQVVDRPELIVRPSSTAPHGLPVGALPNVSELTIDFDDPYAALQAYRLLGEQLERPASSDDPLRFQVVDNARNSLSAWIVRQRSYAWRVGLELAQELEAARQTLAEVVRWESADLSATAPRQVLDAQRRSRRFVLASLAVLVVLLSADVALVRLTDLVTWKVGVISGVVLTLVWLFLSTRVFVRNQRELFRWLHVRDEGRRHRQWALDCSVHVAREVHRLGVLYRQSRQWARVLSAVVHDPFGTGVAAPADEPYPDDLSGSLPLATAVGVAEFDQERHSQLVHEARRAQLGVGWLTAQLHRRIEHALSVRSKRYGRAEHRTVWGDPAYNPQGPLAELVRNLGTVEDRRTAAVQADDHLVSWLRALGEDRGLTWSLDEVYPQVTVTAGAVPGTISGQGFLFPMLRPIDHLDAIGFSATGAASLSNQVERSVLAAVGVPVPPDTAELLRVRSQDARTSMDRFVARLDMTRQVTPDHVSHFASASEPIVPTPGPGEPPSSGITVRL
ncbi:MULTISPECIES: hypothetical protein [unclassified Blastococcus]